MDSYLRNIAKKDNLKLDIDLEILQELLFDTVSKNVLDPVNYKYSCRIIGNIVYMDSKATADLLSEAVTIQFILDCLTRI